MVDKLKKGWFSEISDEMWPGQCFSLAYDEILEDKQTDFQHVVLMKTYAPLSPLFSFPFSCVCLCVCVCMCMCMCMCMCLCLCVCARARVTCMCEVWCDLSLTLSRNPLTGVVGAPASPLCVSLRPRPLRSPCGAFLNHSPNASHAAAAGDRAAEKRSIGPAIAFLPSPRSLRPRCSLSLSQPSLTQRSLCLCLLSQSSRLLALLRAAFSFHQTSPEPHLSPHCQRRPRPPAFTPSGRTTALPWRWTASSRLQSATSSAIRR